MRCSAVVGTLQPFYDCNEALSYRYSPNALEQLSAGLRGTEIRTPGYVGPVGYCVSTRYHRITGRVVANLELYGAQCWRLKVPSWFYPTIDAETGAVDPFSLTITELTVVSLNLVTVFMRTPPQHATILGLE